jgi:anti-sigma factor RsiW
MRDDHLSDRDLVLALDRELPDRRRAAVEAHLRACPSCSARRTRFGFGAQLASSTCRATLPDDERIAASRARLQSRLADIRSRQGTSLIDRIVPPIAEAWRWASVGVAVVATFLVVRVALQPEVRVDRAAVLIESDALPVASLTPGATWNLAVDELCSPDTHEQAEVSHAIRAEVLRAYGMERVPVDRYELDYLITPELGGAPTVQNLWPQRYASRRWNARVKDQLERLLPALVCSGEISLQTAQHDIAVDWIGAYKKYFHTDAPLQEAADARLDDRPATSSRDDDLVYPIWRSSRTAALRLVSFSASR